MPTQTGLDILLAQPGRFLKGKRLGLIANQTSVTRRGELSVQAFNRLQGYQLVKLFAPEHGFYGVEQDMAEVAAETDPGTGLPIISLYGKDEASLVPDPALFEDIDCLVFDIQDIGARYYTFIYTLAHIMQSAKTAEVPVVVLDRPNPINGVEVEGNLIEGGFFSFVGRYPLPNRHGMTVGELALMFRDHFGVGGEATVVPMEGWQRRMWFDDTGFPWVTPSPNMPTLDTAIVYPGMCMVEGTLLSEGRGTTRPFEQAGAPGIDPYQLAENLNREKLPGVYFRPQVFRPTFQKHAGKVCGGVFLQITDRNTFRPVITGVAFIQTVARLFPESFAWRTERYEFVSDRPAIDLLYGNPRFREHATDPDWTLDSISRQWQAPSGEFRKVRENFLLYS